MPLSTGTNIILRSGQDPDALAYFARAGIASGTQTPSSYDNAASFNGTNQFLSIPSNSSLQVGGQAFSFSVWFNVRDVISQKPFLSKIALNNFEYLFGTAGSAIRLLGGNASNVLAVNLAGGNFSANRWNHAVCTYDGTSVVTIYLNGTSVGTSTASITTSGANQFQIGSTSAYGEFLIGDLASIGFWKKALTASEVTALFNNGAGRTYASLDTGLRNNLISWWALNGSSSAVSLTDSHTGGNTLTNTGSVTAPDLGPVVTSLTDSRRLISDFVRGIKSLGLWNSMVCWPLRSSQNAGGGTTAFSLGGLGAFDGTLVNAPTWGANGVVFSNALGTRIDISNNAIFAPQNTTWGAMCVSSQTSGTRADVFGKTGSVEALADLSWGMRENNTTTTLFITNGVTFGGFNVSSTGLNFFRSSVMSYDNTLITGRVNGGTASTLSYTPNAQQNTSQVLRIGAGTLASATNFNGPVAFALFGYFSASQQVALHTLYRQTLGLGLGLP